METYKILRYIVISSEIMAFIVSLYYYNKKEIQFSKSFTIYLGIVSVLEVTGLYFIESKLWDWNVALHKFLGSPFQFLFLFWYLSNNIVIKRQLILFTSIIVYSIAWGYEYIYVTKKEYYDWMSLSFSIASLILIILLLIYFIRLIKSEEILKFYIKQSFWICLGTLIYYLGSFPFYGMGNYLYHKIPDFHLIYFQIVLVLDILMYLLFAASFIWGKEK